MQINQALFTITHAYQSKMEAENSRNLLDLKLSDCSVLMVMHQFAPLNSRELSRIMDINPGTISVYIQRLVDKGLVQKEQDKNDRRNWQLKLSMKGKVAAQGVINEAAKYTKTFLTALSEEEQQQLKDLLLKACNDLGFVW